MKFRGIFTRHYKNAHSASFVHIYKRPYLVPVIGMLIAGLIVLGVTQLRGSASQRPYDSHIVFVFDGGKRQTIDTKATTVGTLVARMPLHLIPQDVVEPSLDTKIVEDNFRINVYRARPVTVVDNGQKTVAITAQKSPRVAAQDAGVVLYPEDNTDFVQGNLRENTIGEQVVVDRATPVALSLYGTPLTVRTHTTTVGELLSEKQVKLSPDDTLTPAADTPLSAGVVVAVVRNGVQVATVEEPINPPTQEISDPNLSLGASAVRQVGVPGKRAVTYQTVTEKGVITSRSVIQTTVVQEAVPQIIARGNVIDVSGDKSSIMAAAGISAEDYGYANYIISHESGWRPSAANASGAYGLCQALPGSKMASAGADWASNPITQLRWCNGYASGKGGWYASYIFWVNHRYW